MPRTVATLVGSLRKESLNRKMAAAVARLAPAELRLEPIEIGRLPLYDQDLDDEQRPPAQWVEFRARVQPADAVLFVTPEYNRSVPGGLKNAIDVGSRPFGKSVWAGKPGAIITVSPGALGGFGANQHLRQTLVAIDVPCMAQPEAYVGGAGKLFGSDGEITNESTVAFLKKFMEAFAHWVIANRR